MTHDLVVTKLSKYYLILDTHIIKNTIYINLIKNNKTDYYRANLLVKYEFKINQVVCRHPKVCFKLHNFNIVLEFKTNE